MIILNYNKKVPTFDDSKKNDITPSGAPLVGILKNGTPPTPTNNVPPTLQQASPSPPLITTNADIANGTTSSTPPRKLSKDLLNEISGSFFLLKFYLKIKTFC